MNDEPKGKSLQDTFEAKSSDKVEQNYAADSDLTRTLLTNLQALLQTSTTAQRLMKAAEQSGITIKFLRGQEEAAYVPENKTIFLSVTTKTKANPRLALMYIGAIREAEQNLLGFARPGQESSDDDWVTKNAVKNLDIITNMCIITKEISEQNQGTTDFLDSLASLGHDEIYEAFVNDASHEMLLRLYAEQEKLTITEG
jgi:hypothetical protein